MKKKKKKMLISMAVMVLTHGLPAYSAGSDDLLEVTTRVEVPGMSMPTQTVQICSPRGKAVESMLPLNSDCKMSDLKRAGNKTTFKMACSSPEPMSGTGEFATAGPNTYRGKMHMRGMVEGEPKNISTTYSSRRIGSCTYEDTGNKTRVQVEAATAAVCRERMEALEWPIFIGEQANEYCKPYRAEFCGRVSELSDKMRDPANHEAKHKNWEGAAAACGQNTQAVLKEACDRAVTNQNWNFVVENCPAEAKQAAQLHCEGDDASSPPAALCEKYTASEEAGRTGFAGQPSATPTAKDNASILEKGAKALKDLLNF